MIKVWLLRPKPHKINRMREFRNDNIIAIGWPKLGSLKDNIEDEIKDKLKNYSSDYSKIQLGIATSTVNKFVNEMRQEDIVVIPDGKDIYFATIKSDYYYDETKSGKDIGYPHQRKVEWIKGPVRRDDIPNELRESLRAPRTLADLSHHLSDILDYIGQSSSEETEDKMVEENDDYAVFDYPVRLNKNATIKIPKDITEDEAKRLSNFVKTLFFE